MTNYEFIKNLDLDDLCEILYSKIICSKCPVYKNCITNSNTCRHNIKIWLSEEHKND